MLTPLSRNMGRKGRLESEPQVRDLYDGRDSGTFIRSEERPAEKGTLRADASNGGIPLFHSDRLTGKALVITSILKREG